jgi:hypothetical protein
MHTVVMHFEQIANIHWLLDEQNKKLHSFLHCIFKWQLVVWQRQKDLQYFLKNKFKVDNLHDIFIKYVFQNQLRCYLIEILPNSAKAYILYQWNKSSHQK